jgi:hypothetical protein
MKTLPVLVLLGGLATSVAIGPVSAAQPAAKAPAASAGKDAKGKKKEDEMGKVLGIEIARPDDRFMGIRVVDGVFRLTFYNAKRKPTPPDITRAVLRWDPKYKIGEERTVLNPGGDENSLTSSKVVRPPLTFKLFITLLTAASDGTEKATETYTVDFRQ